MAQRRLVPAAHRLVLGAVWAAGLVQQGLLAEEFRLVRGVQPATGFLGASVGTAGATGDASSEAAGDLTKGSGSAIGSAAVSAGGMVIGNGSGGRNVYTAAIVSFLSGAVLVVINADTAVEHGQVIAVMDQVRVTEGAQLGIATKKK